MNENTPISGAGLAIGFGLLALAVIVFYDTSQMQVPPTYARVGPQMFPLIIAGGLTLVGVYFAWNSWAPGARREIRAEGFATDWRALAIIAAALVVHLNILKPLGFVVAGIFLFMCVAYAFGSRRYLRDLVVSVLLALVSYLGFKYGLGLPLPPGLLAGVL